MGLFEVSHASTLLSGTIFIFWISYFDSIEQVGVFGIWVTATLLLTQLGALGFHSAIIAYGTKNLKINKNQIYFMTKLGALYSSAAVSIIALGCMLLLFHGVLLDDLTFTALLILCVGIISQSKILVAQCNVTNKAKCVAIANFFRSFSLIAFIGLTFSIDYGDYGFLKLYVMSEVVFFVTLILYSPLNKIIHSSDNLQIKPIAYLKTTAGYAFTNFTFDGTTKIDLISVSFFLPLEAVGVYTLVMNVAEGFLGLSILKRGQFLDWLMKKVKGKKSREIKKFLKDQYRHFGLIMAPIFALGYLYISVISKDISAAAAIALAFNILGIFFLSPPILLFSIFFSLQKSTVLAYFLLLAASVNVSLNVLLIPFIGFVGAAIGTFVSFSILAISINRYVLKKSNW